MTTPTTPLHHALLRPAILHILRAAGFHSTRPSVLDTLTDLAARYFLLLARRTALFASDGGEDDSHGNAEGEVDDGNELEEMYGEGLRRVLTSAGVQDHDQMPGKGEDDVAITALKDQATTFSPPPRTTTEIGTTSPAAQLAQNTSPAPNQPLNTTKAPHPNPLDPNSTPIPQLHHILLTLTTTHVLQPSHTPSETHWTTHLRRPLSTYRAGAAREKERKRRDEVDTRDVRGFVEWCCGGVAGEVRRVAGLESREEEEVTSAAAVGGAKRDAAVLESGAGTGTGTGEETTRPTKKPKIRPDDYIALLKKKYSRVGDGARYQGTVLGKQGVDGVEEGIGVHGRVRIEGGPAESLRGWREVVRLSRGFGGGGDGGVNRGGSGDSEGGGGNGDSRRGAEDMSDEGTARRGNRVVGVDGETNSRRQSAVEAG